MADSRSGGQTTQAEHVIGISFRHRLRNDRSTGRHERVLEKARQLIEGGCTSAEAHAWEAQARHRLGDLSGAKRALEHALSLQPEDIESINQIAEVLLDQGEARTASRYLREGKERNPDNMTTNFLLSRAFYAMGRFVEALELCDRCLHYAPGEPEVLKWRALQLTSLRREGEAQEALQEVLKNNPRDFGANNNLASLYLYQTEYDKAEYHYSIAQEVRPEADQPVSNLLGARHYNPRYSADDLFQYLVERGQALRPDKRIERAETSREPDKRLRVGLLSGGFRTHPVGQMILPAIESLDTRLFELVGYSTNQLEDHLTARFKRRFDAWFPIGHLNNDQLAEKIREDEVDILVDMNGIGEGSRYKALVQEPAPLLVKWVGSLSNTTGLECFDYLISDHVETPEGIDDRYVESLIRLPDDYICYQVPKYAPEQTSLPAIKNGYVTFGCLNNPAKLSQELLEAWALLMQEVPESKLLLRGKQFDVPAFCEKIRATMASYGVEASRLLLEGPSDHRDFLATYQRIDVALDTWPYSGGLTTCEALLMGVPVVTRTGPTFAGRHSATHLTNAGLPELVTDNWEDYRKKVKELVGDLPNLAVIRAALRTVLEESPVCDGERFSRHLTTALRAVWQRHCEGKEPAPLSFEKNGKAMFEGEEFPLRFPTMREEESFDWELSSPVLVIDNGGDWAEHPSTQRLLHRGDIAMLSFDPSCALGVAGHLAHYGEFQCFSGAVLGDGRPRDLYTEESGARVSTLDISEQRGAASPDAEVPSVGLDSIQGLPSLDMLSLDDCHDNLTIMENGKSSLSYALLIRVRVRFNPRYRGEADIGTLTSWANRNGFRFYRFHNANYQEVDIEEGEFSLDPSQLISADALFVPNNENLSGLSDDKKKRLAFMLHEFFGVRDITYEILRSCSEKKAREYIEMVRERSPVKKERGAHDSLSKDANDVVADEVDKLLAEMN
ncbi:O-linked N-acetylglucosamine transferase, SPINDLY family protein [Halomonas koreensis]|uniref:protein O-GlcNAc transferase n=1 Tax=Halomonas koreensis TaxID=245385 RepID=A0ABU1G1Y4_9GAMM|nr:tetratricopeptide repeat protein [Halomonas koreensis]MDR5866925.1 hypothetical protein [Halomonas koreensis]